MPPRPLTHRLLPGCDCSASGRLAEALQENTEATDADLLRKTNPVLAKLLTTHLSSDKAAKALAGLSENGRQCF